MTLSLLALAVADPGLAYTAPAPPAAPDVTGLVTKLVGLTAGLLTLCGLVAWVARRAGRPAAPTGEAGRLRHEGTLVLDRRCSVHLIRADGHEVAVTTDATGVRAIVVLSEPFDVSLSEPGA
ncbi:MAG: hypothetical protein C0501_16595 [Isosphaera sp.]|nr:hypothetical protein [Isosphaera sp.]